jgi:hypothetical protein
VIVFFTREVRDLWVTRNILKSGVEFSHVTSVPAETVDSHDDTSLTNI